MYSFVPFGLLFLVNILLTVDLRQNTRYLTTMASKRRSQLSMNVSVVIMTILFIVFTCPGAVCSQFYNVLVTTHTGNIILFVSDCFAFSYHALNTIVLCATNKDFMRKFKVALALECASNTTNNAHRNTNATANAKLSIIHHF